METTDTIYNVNDSVWVMTRHAEDLAGYMTENYPHLDKFTQLSENADINKLAELCGLSALVGIATAFILVILAVAISRGYFKKLRKWAFFRKLHWLLSLFTLKKWFFFGWLFGFVVYDVGMCTGQYISLLTNAPMALLYGFKIFLFDSDVSEIHGIFHSNWIYSFLFALAHCLAAFISTIFLLKLFGYTMLQRLSMWWASLPRIGREVAETYVFWGFNDSVCHLVESIQKHYYYEGKDVEDKIHTDPGKECRDKRDRKTDRKAKNNHRIIIIRTNDDDDDSPEKKTGFARIFNFLSLQNRELKRLQKLECYIDVTSIKLSSIDLKEDGGNEVTSNRDIIGKTLRMRSLRRLLKRKTTRKIHMLFLSDDETDNIHNVALLRQDSTLKDFTNEPAEGPRDNPETLNTDGSTPKREVIFYCHARYNSVHRVIEDLISTENIKVKVVDSSHLSVEELKQKREVLPVDFVDIKADGTVSSPFNALVVGFSEVGQDSVRFLYEFGAFVDSASPQGQPRRSGFHLDVVDNRMHDLAGAFVANAPAIRQYISYKSADDKASTLITLHNMNCNSIEFYDMLARKIETLNYLIIATEDDELNISLGVRISRLAMRYRKDMEKFCILVRAHNDEDEHIRKIARYYNWLYKAAESTGDVTDIETTSAIYEKYTLPLYVFGLDKEIYTYDNIIDNKIEKGAARFAREYDIATAENNVKDKNGKQEADSKTGNPPKPVYAPKYRDFMKNRRTHSQDIANYLHQATKLATVDKAKEAAGMTYENIRWTDYSRRLHQIRYVKDGKYADDFASRLLKTLARMEHLRWNAAHEILGYTREGEVSDKDEVRMTHSCIRQYHEFDLSNPEHVKTLSYDNVVVDLTLGIPRRYDNSEQADD